MRFTALSGLMRFILFLQGLGFKYPGSLYDLQMRLKKLPDYISRYQVEFRVQNNNFYITLEKNKRPEFTIEMEGHHGE